MRNEIVYKEEYKGYLIEIYQDDSSDSPDDWNNTDVFLVYDHDRFFVKRDNFNPEDINKSMGLALLSDKLKKLKKKLSEIKKSTIYYEDRIKKDLIKNAKLDIQKIKDKIYDLYNGEIQDYSDYWIFPVFAYIHSMVILSLSDSSYPHTCPWDTSFRGFILVEKVQEWYIDNSTKEVNIHTEKAEEQAQGLIETWNNYLSSNVYGYEICKPVEYCTIDKDIMQTTEHFDELRSKLLLNTTTEWETIDSCWGFYGNYNDKYGALSEAKSIIDSYDKT
jgi:hypothetical protein